MLADAVAYLCMGLATEGWIVFVLLPLMCLGGLAGPALQALVSAGVDAQRQGQVQGVLASVMGLVAAVGPLLVSTAYFATRATLPGIVWIAGALAYGLCLAWMLAGASPGRARSAGDPTPTSRTAR